MVINCFVILLLISNFEKSILQQYEGYTYESDFLDMDPDSILEENAIITANATCGVSRREYFCRLVEHAEGSTNHYNRIYRPNTPAMTYNQDAKSYRDRSGQWIQCDYCDDKDPNLRHPIEYVLRGEYNLWWQSPSLAQGLQHHAVTITMDFRQVYQIVYVLLRMGDSPRPTNWILERSIDGENYKAWVFFAKTEYDCIRLYESTFPGNLTVTSAPRPWQLADDEVYCTTFYSQPQALQSGEIIVTLTLDRESTITGLNGVERPISKTLIDFLSARYVRLRFQQLQTLSGDWMSLPNQLDSSVYNRYYYSIRTIKVGGKCVCNSHANRCQQKVIDGVARAMCVCQHNTCGNNCENCCPLFNQYQWRPGRKCEQCNCNRKTDQCVYNQTVANLRLSLSMSGIREGGGVCLNCTENTDGVNCEKCKPGFYRPLNVRPDASFPCTTCECDTLGSTGICVSNDAEVPLRYPGDCICKPGYAGRKCELCAEGYQRSKIDPLSCVPCSCDIRGSHRGGGYQCEPPCNCKVNVAPDSLCTECQLGHFNLDMDNPEGCQACYCSGLTENCQGVGELTSFLLKSRGLLGAITNMTHWTIIIPNMVNPEYGYKISSTSNGNAFEQARLLTADIHAVETWFSSISSSPVNRGYYWSAPRVYLGKQITAYRSVLEIILSFKSNTMQSFMSRITDTGYSIAMNDQLNYLWLHEPDVVFEGNGYRLVHLLPMELRKSHIILKVPIHESSFRVLVEPQSSIPLEKFPIGWMQGAGMSNEQVGRPATVADLMIVLSNIERLLIKTKYISDQSTAELLSVTLNRPTADKPGGIPSIEECVCPSGHTGTSCESCSPGYRHNRTIQRSRTPVDKPIQSMWRMTAGPLQTLISQCIPCECNGHSNECDENTGTCIECEHNTAGDHCDVCAPGYYGDPKTGGINACNSCECPSLDYQMTTSCSARGLVSLNEQKPYVCLDCSANTRGQYCEQCAEMHFGNPANGIPCSPCNCGVGAIACNATNAACICGYNTGGPMCDACAEGTHGDPLTGQTCRPCNCHSMGSVSPTCRLGDGQCTCKPSYEGTRCERCIVGRGNVDIGCPLCKCDPIGTKPESRNACDQITGQCDCKDGVGGTLDCSQCAPGFYNMGPNGCTECRCTPKAIDRTCDAITGTCKCGENVIGDTCDSCAPGHYWNETGPNCIPCDCGIGTQATQTITQKGDCEMIGGQCKCAPHVIGRDCNECEPGYFGVSPEGCKECPKCPNGQVCDRITGKCICPPNTEGDQCDKCTTGSYDYNPISGCKVCNCSAIGTVDGKLSTCDLVTGQCTCKQGYNDRACDRCKIGYYNYPNCKVCDCDMRGTKTFNITTSNLDNVIVTCDEVDGRCKCKQNVEGKRCDQCKPGSFGLNIEYPLGCYDCFCFPTDLQAKCALLTGYRSVPGKIKGLDVISSDDPRFPGGPLVDLKLVLSDTDIMDLTTGVSQFSWRFSIHRPTHLIIPELKGSLMRGYGSVIVAISTECLPTGDCRLVSPRSDPTMAGRTDITGTDLAGRLVIRRPALIDATMTAQNGQLEFEYQPSDDSHKLIADGYRQIWLREQDWVLTRVGDVDTRVRPSRNELMLALLNVTRFTVRLFMPESKPKLVNVKYKIYEALTEIQTMSGTEIKSIEKCTCPTTATGDHCEQALSGFHFPNMTIKPGPDILPPAIVTDPTYPSTGNVIWIGGVDKCDCHGMSSHCDPVTGVCKDCTGHTKGDDCGQCESGYYGDPKTGKICQKCRCPTEQTDYAISCTPVVDGSFVAHKCICKPGYTGQRCESCTPGYFGDPTSMVACQSCDCDPAGSISTNCDQATGQCQCWPGIKGRRCDQCQVDHVVDAGTCRDCRGACTGELLINADETKRRIENLNLTSLAYQGLSRPRQRAETAQKRFHTYMVQRQSDTISLANRFNEQVTNLQAKFDRIRIDHESLDELSCGNQLTQSKLLTNSNDLKQKIGKWINRLEKQEFGNASPTELAKWREQARLIEAELRTIDFGEIKNWLNLIDLDAKQISGTISEMTSAFEISNSLYKIGHLKNYQQDQKFLTDYVVEQVYQIGNATGWSTSELKLAKKKSAVMSETVKSATDTENIAQFNSDSKALKDQLDNLDANRSKLSDELYQQIELEIKQLKEIQLPQIESLSIRPLLIGDKIEPLEREAKQILDLLSPTPSVNNTMNAYNSYQAIVEKINEAENATKLAETNWAQISDLSVNMSGSLMDTLTHIQNKRKEMDINLTNQLELLNSYNGSMNDADEVLDGIKEILKTLTNTASNTLTNAQNVGPQVESTQQILADTTPMVDNVAGVILDLQGRLDNTHERLLKAEKTFAQIQGTAQSTVDRASTAQTGLDKLIQETESGMQQLDSKLAQLRQLSDEAKVLLDVNYGAIGHDPIPLQFTPDCVYTIIPYSITKTRVFDISFWFNLHEIPTQTTMSSVLMVGRRAFEGRTQMFAFTVEAPDARLRFSWNVPNGILEIGQVLADTWYEVRVTSVAGETRMFLDMKPASEGTPSSTKQAVTANGQFDQEAILILDRQTEIRIGGITQSGSRLVNPQAWGDNSAERFWSRLISMESVNFCLFNLKITGQPISLVNFGDASNECVKTKQLQCQLPLFYRETVRNGYVWNRQAALDKLTTSNRPDQLADPPFSLTRMFFYDFNGDGGYAQIKSFNDLEFARDHIVFQINQLFESTPIPHMTVMTFYNYDKDYGITIELINGNLEATHWLGNDLYRLDGMSSKLNMEDNIRKRILRSYTLKSRLRRQTGATTNTLLFNTKKVTTNAKSARKKVNLNVIDYTLKIVSLEPLVTTDRNDYVVLYLGAIPPKHYHLRRRMRELGLSLTPFSGRIGFTNGKPGQGGDFYLDDYAISSVTHFGDTHFTDFRQRGEIRMLQETHPKSQYCLFLTPHDLYTAPELKNPHDYDPFSPGVSMTIRFDPLSTKSNHDIDLVSIQLDSAEWIRIFLTNDHRIGIVMPGVNKKLITKTKLSSKSINDPGGLLFNLELVESQNASTVLPFWNDLNERLKNKLDMPTNPVPLEIEMVVTIYFNGLTKDQLVVLFDQRIVQTWPITKSGEMGSSQQIFIGPHVKLPYPITINHLLIGKHLVDFSSDLVRSEDQQVNAHYGTCGGSALHPRFISQPGLLQAVTYKYQGLGLTTPPTGRRLVFIPFDELLENRTIPSVSINDSIQLADGNLRKRDDCTENRENTAWFDQSPQSYWQIDNVGTIVENGDKPFEFAIGFRAQFTTSTGMGDSGLPEEENAAQLSAQPTEHDLNTLLAVFNFGPDHGNLYIILLKNQIVINGDDENRIWTSPLITITDTTWHRLKLTLHDALNGEQNGQSGTITAENGIQLSFDHRHFWLPKFRATGLPSVVFIGGLPQLPSLRLTPGGEPHKIHGLFGCIDELVFNGVTVEPKTSGRPACFDCFSMNPTIVHIPQSIDEYLTENTVELQIPKSLLDTPTTQLTFDFNFFYDHNSLKQSSLFVLNFVRHVNDTDVRFHLWLFLTNNEVKMGYVSLDDENLDMNHGVTLSNLAYSQNIWHFIRLDIILAEEQALFILKSQLDKSTPLVSLDAIGRLESINFGTSTGLTAEKISESVYDYDGRSFKGCIRNMRLSTDNEMQNVYFPDGLPGLLYGICHTILTW